MARVPQLYNLDVWKLTAPFHPLPSLAQEGGWHARAEGPEDEVRILIADTAGEHPPPQPTRVSSLVKGKA